MTEPIWKEHPSYPGYVVSDSGLVRGLRGHLLSPHTVIGGYQRVRVARAHRLVHVLVAEVFIGPKPDGHQVNHKDGDTANNAASNLEWITPAANVRHSLDVLGVKRARGSRNGAARLTEEKVAAIRAEFAAGGVTRGALAQKYGVNRSTVGRIISGRYWAVSTQTEEVA